MNGRRKNGQIAVFLCGLAVFVLVSLVKENSWQRRLHGGMHSPPRSLHHNHEEEKDGLQQQGFVYVEHGHTAVALSPIMNATTTQVLELRSLPRV